MFRHLNNPSHGTTPLQTFILLAGATFLFWEWLKPLPVISTTESITPFLLFFLFAVMVKVLRLPTVLENLLVGFSMIYFFHYLYLGGPFFSWSWVEYLSNDLLYSLQLLWERDFVGHSYYVKTIVFYLLIWGMATYLYRAVVVYRRLFAFFLCTLVYLAILDTFSPMRQDDSIIRTFIVGLVLLAFLEIVKIIQSNRKSIVYRQSFPYKGFVFTLVMILVVSSLGYVAPKAAPNWPDPASFIQSYAEHAAARSNGSGLVQRVGYSDQDEFLGGPFVQDSKIVFKATTPKKHYWRGESKDYYTGHGWINTSKYPERYAPQHFNDFLLHDEFKLYEEEVKIEEIEIDVQMKSRRYSTLFYPGEPTRVHLDPLGEEVQVDRREGHITFWENQEQPNHYSEYQMKSTYPKFQIKALREASMNEVPSEIMNRYTQLPNTLPARVGELAEELTKNDENPYDKVKKIEGFFRRFGYEYETKDVPIPKEGQDYVDQFVFETKRGYCNNFSTSMVVMLRTVGIPARWVKGFTFGEITAQERGVYTTQVRNLNAHSWVEVYFPGSGWVPFEPTKAYDNPYPFEIDRTTPDTSSLPDMTDLEQRLKQDFPDIPERDQEDRDVAGAGSKSKPWYQSKYFTISLSVFFALGVLGVLFYWKKIMISWIIARYRRNQDPQLFLKAYEVMLQLVGKWVVRRDPSQTMREYVVALESRVSQEELRPLTKIFEEMRYGNKKTEEGQLHKAYQLWERVLKKMRS